MAIVKNCPDLPEQPHQPEQPAQVLNLNDISQCETDRLDRNWQPRAAVISQRILSTARLDEEERCAEAELTSLLQAYIPVQQIPRLIEAAKGHLLFDLSVESYIARGFSGYTRVTSQVSTTGAWLFREDTSGNLGPMAQQRFFLTSEQITGLFYALLMTWQRNHIDPHGQSGQKRNNGK